MRRITQIFVNRPPMVFVLLTVVALAGAFALGTIVQQMFPNIDFPVVDVSVSYPGASPSELRDSVVRPIEDAIAGAPDLDYINTSIQQNQASIAATFTLSSNQTTDLTEVQNRLQAVKAALPQDLPAPSVRSYDPAQATVVTLAATSRSLNLQGLSAIVTNDVVPALEQVDGVSNVQAGGVVTPALEVTVNPLKLAAYGFTTTDVVSAIQANNTRAPGGIAYAANRETSLDVRGDVQTPASIAETLLGANTATLHGATSPSGTLTVKYSSTSGSTNQALALGNANVATSAVSATSAFGSIGGSSVSSAVPANAGAGTAPTVAPQSTLVLPGATLSTPLPASPSPAAASGAIAAAASSGATPNPTATVTGSSPAPAVVTPLSAPTPAALSSASPTGIAAGSPALESMPAASMPTSAAATTTTGQPASAGKTAIEALAGGSGAASSGVAAAVTEPFSTSPFLPRVGDVATVTDGYEPRRVASYVDGNPAITLEAEKATGASEVTAGKAVIAALPRIESQFPDIDFKVLNVQANVTEAQLWGVLQTLLEAIAFTGIAMLVFLKSWRNALVVMIAIPASLCVTLFVMRVVGFTIDTVSLLAMTLIIGILVDDSIVVLENIERHYENGEAPRTAAILGRSEIGVAAIVITLVDVVVFLPIAFLPGMTGRFLAEFAVVVTIATLTSLAVSFTVTPSLAGNWSLLSRWRAPRPILAFATWFERLRNFYSERLLRRALRHPKKIVAASAIGVIAAVALIPLGLIGFEFIPRVDRGQIFVHVQLPTGTPLARTDADVRALTDRFLSLPHVAQITSSSGSYRAGFGAAVNLGSNGQLEVFLDRTDPNLSSAVAAQMTRLARRVTPGARVIAIPATATGGGNGQPIDVTVSATRGDPTPYAQQILGALEDTPGTANVNSSAISLSPQLDIEFDRNRARALNVNIGLAAQAVRAAFGGTLATQFDTVNGTKYVQVLYPAADQTSPQTLLSIPIRNGSGAIVHLGDIATLQNAPAQALLARTNRQTVIHVSANLAPGVALSTAQKAFMARVAALHLPDTIIVGTGAGGSQEELQQTIVGLAITLGLSFLLVYLLMVALYNAYRSPLVIMFSIPVASIGAFGALALTGQTLNLYSLIGVVMLVGLVSKNGILLVDFAVEKVAAGMDKTSAIVAAARQRFRPIIMTTVSMISGMLPLALALDPGSAAKRSLGTVVIGGLASSLLLTLVLVPVVFLWIAPEPQVRTDDEGAHASRPEYQLAPGAA